MRSYADLLVRQLTAQADMLKSLTKHQTLVGTGREGAFRHLLGDLVPKRYEVLEGAIAGPSTMASRPMRARRQVDCMIVDTFGYPTLYRRGNLAVVLKQAVRAVVELKGKVFSAKKGIDEAEVFFNMLVQIGSLKEELQLELGVMTALFIFADKITLTKLHSWMAAAIAQRDQLVRTGKQQSVRDGLTWTVLPNYIVTSSGIVVEKSEIAPTYSFYDAGRAEAVTFLLGSLLRSVSRSPVASTALPIIAGAPTKNRTRGRAANRPPMPVSFPLNDIYSAFAAHFGEPKMPAVSATLDITDLTPPSAKVP